MNAHMMRLVIALLWLSGGAYCLYERKAVRAYLSQLRDSPGNRRLKKRRLYFRIAGAVAIGIGLWQLFSLFR